MMISTDNKPKLLILKIKLMDIRPIISREVLVRNTVTFEKLHTIIQTAMGWDNMHLHEFIKDNTRVVANIEEEMPSERFHLLSAQSTPIAMLLRQRGDKMLYVYDFGDDWLHELTATKVLPDDPEAAHPVCTKALRACPPEDCGGPPGYYQIQRILKSGGRGEEFEELRDWLGDGFDPDHADIEMINRYLKFVRM